MANDREIMGGRLPDPRTLNAPLDAVANAGVLPLNLTASTNGWLSVRVPVTDGSGSATDVSTGYSAAVKVKNRAANQGPGDTTKISLSSAGASANGSTLTMGNGYIDIDVSPDDLLVLRPNQTHSTPSDAFVWDLVLTNTGTSKAYTLARGWVEVFDGVTF